MAKRYPDPNQPPAVSIITCTNRPACLANLLGNYRRQQFIQKELILILNNDQMHLRKYRKLTRKLANVRVYQLSEKTSLGSCLNFGVQKAKYNCLAKFDDDDFYAPRYLSDNLEKMCTTNADIIGKRAHFMYLEGPKVLLFRYHTSENQYVPIVQGATLIIKREVFDQVTFSDQTTGECLKFCANCRAKGFKIYSGDRFNFVAIRKKDAQGHTWPISDQQLISGKAIALPVQDYKSFATRPAIIYL